MYGWFALNKEKIYICPKWLKANLQASLVFNALQPVKLSGPIFESMSFKGMGFCFFLSNLF